MSRRFISKVVFAIGASLYVAGFGVMVASWPGATGTALLILILAAVCSTIAGLLNRPDFIRQLRHANDQCIACGYDLTGNTSGVCPECGTAIVEA